MTDKIEMSLAEIISKSKIGRPRVGGRGGGGGGGGVASRVQRNRTSNRGRQVGSGGANRVYRRGGASGAIIKGRPRGPTTPSTKFPRGDVNSAWKHDMYEGGKKILRTGGVTGSVKLLVSNLDYGVSETDIHELFADFGPLKNASVHYDRSGRSLGTADVVFERRSDALKAMKQYNGVPLDGRPMNIQLATSEVPIPAVRKSRTPISPSKPNRRVSTGPNNRLSGGTRNRTKMPKQKPSLEELDAELDAYVNDMKL